MLAIQPAISISRHREISFAKSRYGKVVSQAITDLHIAGVRMMSIVGDNHPIQVSVLAHWN
jgi:hypothetical protein